MAGTEGYRSTPSGDGRSYRWGAAVRMAYSEKSTDRLSSGQPPA